MREETAAEQEACNKDANLLLAVIICQALLPYTSAHTGCMAALEAEHFLQEHDVQQGKSEPSSAENNALPDNGHAPKEMFSMKA